MRQIVGVVEIKGNPCPPLIAPFFLMLAGTGE
jgi:hypothetical protein